MTARVSPSQAPPKWLMWPSRLRAPVAKDEAVRIERVISVARLFLTIIAVTTLNLDPAFSSSGQLVTEGVLILFAAHSISAVIVLRWRPRTSRGFGITVHIIDLVAAAAMSLPFLGNNNSFFAFFLFVLAAAAFRWGFWETLLSAIAAIALIGLEARFAGLLPAMAPSMTDAEELRSVIGRAGYLAMMGLLLGYMAEEGRQLRAETASIVRLMGSIRLDSGITRALDSVAHELLALFNAGHLLLVVQDVASRRMFRWDSTGGWSVTPTKAADEVPGTERQQYFFGSAEHSLAAVRRLWPWSLFSRYRMTTLDASGRLVDSARWAFPHMFTATYRFRRLIAVPVSLGDEWSGRLFIFDPSLDLSPRVLAHFLRTVVQQAAPAVFNVYLLNRLRTRAGAIERARVARELHDGVIQALIGVEMQLQVLRGNEAVRDKPIEKDLSHLQDVLREEVLSLRELMQQMRPPELAPDELLDYLADMVARFGRDTGIKAHFTTDLQEVSLPRHVCFELVRIVQEGLANIRKHSKATNVVVRFGVRDGFWTLGIDDDGKGFVIDERLSQADVNARMSGPVMIKERVRAIGGQLAIDSAPGHGTRLNVLVPQEAHG
jgi:signal transduction histidine kinase